MLDAPWVENGKFTRIIAPARRHPLANLTQGGSRAVAARSSPRERLATAKASMRWTRSSRRFETLERSCFSLAITTSWPMARPWSARCKGDVWRIEGLDDSLSNVRWQRFASGLHQALGLVVADGKAYVLGRDQITRLHDLDGDGEADFTNAFPTPTPRSTGRPRLHLRPRRRRGPFLHVSVQG